MVDYPSLISQQSSYCKQNILSVRSMSRLKRYTSCCPAACESNSRNEFPFQWLLEQDLRLIFDTDPVTMVTGHVLRMVKNGPTATSWREFPTSVSASLAFFRNTWSGQARFGNFIESRHQEEVNSKRTIATENEMSLPCLLFESAPCS